MAYYYYLGRLSEIEAAREEQVILHVALLKRHYITMLYYISDIRHKVIDGSLFLCN